MDDVVLFGQDADNLKDALENFQHETAALELRVSCAKTNIWSVGAKVVIQDICVSRQTVVHDFIYLCSK